MSDMAYVDTEGGDVTMDQLSLMRWSTDMLPVQ